MNEQVSQLHRLVLERVQAAAGDSPQPAGAEVESADYDWSVPHHFTAEQLERIDQFAAGIAERVCEVLLGLLHEPVEFELASVTQHYGGDRLDRQAPEGGDSQEPQAEEGSETQEAAVEATDSHSGSILDAAGRPCGLIVLPPVCASDWVRKLLGGQEATDGQRELSVLESALLADIASAVVDAFSVALQTAGGRQLRADEQILKGQGVLPGQASSEFCQIDLRQKDSQDPQVLSFVLFSETLEAAAGVESQRAKDSPAGDSGLEMTAHLERTPVTATALVGNAKVSMHQIATLEIGDVLLLDRQVDEPIDLIVQDRAVLCGFPVVSAGCYAVQIASPAESYATSSDQDKAQT